ncbi:hypothetical protein B0H13DRAFT_1926826 [Mycena leptocephala]|nr:hypothetical protein B0H13DRAFT_1926826 [Mycena leptocephala]
MSTGEPQPSSPMPHSRVLSYEVATTSIFYGLPPYEQHQILRHYRGLFHEQARNRECQVGATDAFAETNISYDIGCQYFKNIHALDLQGTHTDSDDSLFEDDDDDEGPPPLIPPWTPDADGPKTTVSSSPDLGADGSSALNTTTTASMPEVDGDVSLAPKIGTAAKTMSPWNAGRNTHWSSLGLGLSRPNSPAEAHLDPGLDGGEATERAWAELNKLPGASGEMGPGFRQSVVEPTGGELHKVEIVALRGVREVECTCIDGLHSEYGRRQYYAFLDQDGNVVIKNMKTLLLPLN